MGFTRRRAPIEDTPMTTLPQRATNDNQDDYMTAVRQAQAALSRAAAIKTGPGASFADREAALLAASNDATRFELEALLQAIADGMPDKLLVNDVVYARHQDGAADYHSLCGSVRIRRATYRRPDERNGKTIVPLELQAGLIEGATPALAYRVTLGYAQGPSRHAEEQMLADHRRPPSRSSLERTAKAIGTTARVEAPRIEPLLRASEQLPEGARAISVGLDRTSVPMEEVRAADAPPAAAPQETQQTLHS